VIQDTMARIHAGAREAGRNPADVDIWFTTRTSLHEDRDTAIANVKASVPPDLLVSGNGCALS
jgi:alkanesulfonate monooxygenase SsuD/methylene tetrahydromethanopterin reductase-like flavin-dependent oxidoreductase (luciferase family)